MDTNTLSSFGKVLRKVRNEKGWSQEELAERAKVHRTYIGMLERGEKNITLLNLRKISKALGVNASELVKKTEKYGSSRKD